MMMATAIIIIFFLLSSSNYLPSLFAPSAFGDAAEAASSDPLARKRRDLVVNMAS